MSEGTPEQRRATLLASLAAVIVLAAGFAVWAGLESSGSDTGNTAVADRAATAEVTDQVGTGVKAVFSYDYSNLPRTERAAAGVLVEGAAAQYQSTLAAAEKQATDQKLVRSTTIRSIGVRELRGENARLLVFVDQQTIKTVENQQTSSAAYLDITAKKIDGTWKITTFTAL
jgi:Mce-associated membrane protein